MIRSHVLRRLGEFALLGLFLFVAMGVLGRADLAAPGVDARATLSFALDYFAGRFGRHIYY